MSDRDSDPAPFVRNSYIPETQQYLNYYGCQCYYEEPQTLPQYYYFPQSQPQGPQVEGAGAAMRNIKVSINRKSRILPNKTRSNCLLATIRFCMASKQQRRAIKTFRGSILIRDQSMTGNDIKRNALSRNLGIYLH